MTTGASRNQIIVLSVLLVIAAGGVYFNFIADTPPAAPPVRSAATTPPPVTPVTPRRQINRNNATDFKPRLSTARPEDRPDPSTIDPELRLDLLAKVQSVPPMSASRNLFQYGSAPPPISPLPQVPGIAINGRGVPPPPVRQPPPPVPTGPAGPPAPAPINVKYYGYITSRTNGRRVAFLQDGDQVLLISETETVKGHYRVLQIGVSSIVFEETESKTRQTLPIQEQPG